MNKRGTEMSIGMIIAIVLAIVILTILVVTLTTQTSLLSSNVNSQGSDSNVDAVVVACEGLVASQSTYAYCCEERDVILGEGVESDRRTCDEISLAAWASDRVGMMDCSSVSCAPSA